MIDIAENIIVNFYKAVVVFVELYRNCLNQVGWDKIVNFKRIDTSLTPDNLPLFTQAKDGDFIL